MFHLAHLRHRVGKLDYCRMRIPPRQYNVHHLRLILQALHHFRRIKHAVADGIVNFVQDHQVPFARLYRFLALVPGLFHHAHVFRIRLFRAHLHEAATHLLHDEFIAERFYRIQFAIVPRAFQKLQHEHTHALSHGPQRRSHSGSCFALARTSVDNDQTATHVLHKRVLIVRVRAVSSEN